MPPPDLRIMSIVVYGSNLPYRKLHMDEPVLFVKVSASGSMPLFLFNMNLRVYKRFPKRLLYPFPAVSPRYMQW